MSENLIVNLIRHGEPEDSATKPYNHCSAPLNTREKDRIAEMTIAGVYPKTQAVYTLPFESCIETAQIIYRLPILVLDNFEAPKIEQSLEDISLEMEQVYSYSAKLKHGLDSLLENIYFKKIDNISIIGDLMTIRIIVRHIIIPKSLPQVIDINYAGGMSLEYNYKLEGARIIRKF